MIKLRNILFPLNECVIARMSLDGNVCLAKNRDRMYAPDLEVVHEIVNDVEIVYMRDIITDWSEGMNEKGIGVVNASLMVNFDEREGDIAKEKAAKGKTSKPSYDGLKIRTALSKKKLSEAIRSIVSFKGQDKNDVGVKGMTIVSTPNHSFIIEMTSKHLPTISKLDKDALEVRTNHGVAYPSTGYTKGIKRASSISRQDIARNALSKIETPDQVLGTMATQHSSDKFMNPYRRDNSYDMATSSQVLMNLNKRTFEFRHDSNESRFKGFVNKLPKSYKPKIKVTINSTND